MALPAYIDESTGAITDGEAWVALATATPSGANVSFTSTDDGQVGDWSQYLDLVVIGYARSGVSGTGTTGVYLRLNNDTGSNYAWQQLASDGTGTPSADNQTAISYIRFGMAPQVSATANIFGSYVIDFSDINSGKYKSVLCQGACDMNGSGNANVFGSVWKNQDPIIEIDLIDDTGFVAGSRFDLFGILPRMVA